jgi:hypothetical protein
MSEARRVEGYIIGCDLGQANDFTALSILEKHREDSTPVEQKGFKPPASTTTTRNVFHLRHLQRLKLGTGYPDVVNIVGTMLKSLPQAKGAPALVIDKTGVGAPIYDLMQKAGLRPIAVTITGGHDESSPAFNQFLVPKRNLVSTLAVILQSGRLKVAPDLREAETFIRELSNFKVKISAAGHDSYNAWRESVHDDLVLSVALAAWWAERPAYVGGGCHFGSYGRSFDHDTAGAIFASQPPEYWAAQGIFHSNDKQMWIDRGIWKPPEKEKNQ